jgi:hypothetical protein
VHHVEESEVEGAELQGPRSRHLLQLGVVQHPVLLELGPQDPQSQLGAVDGRDVHLLQQVGQPADVVLVGVGQQDADHPVLALLEVGEVGQDQVHAQHLLGGEHQADVDHEDLAAVLEQGHVAADLPQASEEDDLGGVLTGGAAVVGAFFRRQAVLLT